MTLNHMLRLTGTAGALALACGAAQAQFDYEAYGVVDFSYGRFEPSGQVPLHRFNSNSLTASFVGVNAKYGLDDGWTPGITLESFVRFQDRKLGRRDDDPILSRNAFVSLGSRYGTLRVGRLQTLLFDATNRFNAMGNSLAFSPAMRHVFAAGNLIGVQGDFYWDRAISYSSPDFDGIRGSVMLSQGENNRRGDLAAATLIVAQGLFASAVSVQKVHFNDGIADPTDETTLQLGATYNLFGTKLFAQYTQTNDNGLDVTGRIFSAGAAVALGPGTLQAQVAASTAKGPAVSRKQTSISAAYLYAWDSVTDFYAVVMDDRVRGQTRGVSAAVGVRWRF